MRTTAAKLGKYCKFTPTEVTIVGANAIDPSYLSVLYLELNHLKVHVLIDS